MMELQLQVSQWANIVPMLVLSTGLFFMNMIQSSDALTGHVCSNQKAETYQTTYDRAFICPQRYTTACGQLDWRRCTKYRVNTCFTPSEKYAIRYKTVEQCCPGWRDAGGGRCIVPACEGRCMNGGICSPRDVVPICKCPDGFYGDLCQQERSVWMKWGQKHVALVTLITALITLAIILAATYKFMSKRNLPSPRRMQLAELDSEHRQRLIEHAVDDSSHAQLPSHAPTPATETQHTQPSAPLRQ